jgi:hypothetical protein
MFLVLTKKNLLSSLVLDHSLDIIINTLLSRSIYCFRQWLGKRQIVTTGENSNKRHSDQLEERYSNAGFRVYRIKKQWGVKVNG